MGADMILCDVMMPDMDGPTLLSRLRENPRNDKIPVVFMTARAQHSELEQLKRLGAAAVLTKPFDPMTLAATVRSELIPSGRMRSVITLPIACEPMRRRSRSTGKHCPTTRVFRIFRRVCDPVCTSFPGRQASSIFKPSVLQHQFSK